MAIDIGTNSIDQNGLTIQTAQEIINEIANGTAGYPGMYQIYGYDINFDPNSPDGQMINIIAQAKLDVLEFIQQVYNSFDPDKAIGVSLNRDCAINGVVRNPGTFTLQTVQVTATMAVTLPGLNTAPTAPFTISDTNGNQYALVSTYVFGAAGVETLIFQAVLLGPVSSLPNTITTLVTILAGISGVNNSTGPTSVGLTEETDYALRIRRQNSVSLPSKGYLQGLYGALLDVVGVTAGGVKIDENYTNSTNANGTPAHSIWCIVNGGANSDVANAIYVKRNAGCGMKGSVNVPIVQVDGSTFTVQFDRPISQPLWISFNVAAIGSGSVDPHYISLQLQALLSYAVNQQADVTTIVALVRQISPNALVTAEGVSTDGVTYTSLVSTTTIQDQFAVSGANIIINGVPNP